MKKTLANLTKAFIGESQARNRYTFYASQARKEGYEQIAEIFQVTANNEKEHAKKLFEHIQQLKGNLKEINVEAAAPTVFGNTVQNLKAAIAGEHYENIVMYPSFAKIAKQEKLPTIAKRLLAISKAEEHHEERYKKLLAIVSDRAVFKKEKAVKWICRECGYVHTAKEAPKKCPACDHSQAFYQIKCEAY